MSFKKICKYCGKDFESESRNTRYCCQECCDKAQEVNKKKIKTRKRKRKEYDKNKEINRALSSAYSLAHKVAELYRIPKKCSCHLKGYQDECSGELQLHHDNGNPFDNSPQNLLWFCNHHHAMADEEHGRINMVDTYNECVDGAGFEEEEDKSSKMIEIFLSKLGVEVNG